MQLLYLSTCLNNLLVNGNLSIYKYFCMTVLQQLLHNSKYFIAFHIVKFTSFASFISETYNVKQTGWSLLHLV